MLRFEYDQPKSKSNKQKHGIDFEEAQELWKGTIVQLSSKFPDEPRKLVIGRIRKKFWTAITTKRESTIRIISVRRARHEEKRLYEEVTKNKQRES